MVLDEQRKEEISDLVLNLKARLGINGEIDFPDICRKLNIHYLFCDDITEPHAARNFSTHRNFIVFPSDYPTKLLPTASCHELGHLFLGHIKKNCNRTNREDESEANYFASELLGKDYNPSPRLIMKFSYYLHFNRPLLLIKSTFFGNEKKALDNFLHEYEKSLVPAYLRRSSR